MNSDLIIKVTALITNKTDLIVTPFSVSIELYLLGENEDEPKEPIEIGYITAYRFNLRCHPNNLFFAADRIGGDLARIHEFFIENKRNYSKIKLNDYLFYIEKVYLESRFRGRGYALRSLAIFLELFASDLMVVCCHPNPFEDLEKKYPAKKGKLLMRKYWAKLGLTEYNQKHNIFWKNYFSTPEWLLKNYN
jgi:hypothetical protein